MQEKQTNRKTPNYRPPKGIGFGMGMAIGIIIGAATDNLGLWLALGLIFGVAFDGRRNGRETDPSTPKGDGLSTKKPTSR